MLSTFSMLGNPLIWNSPSWNKMSKILNRSRKMPCTWVESTQALFDRR